MQPWEAKNTVTLTVSLTSIFLRGRGNFGYTRTEGVLKDVLSSKSVKCYLKKRPCN